MRRASHRVCVSLLVAAALAVFALGATPAWADPAPAGDFTPPPADPGTFFYPGTIAVGADGRIFIADTENNRIQVFSSDGEFLTSWGGPGPEPGRFSGPSGIAFDASGSVYVTDYFNHRVQVFDPSGTFLRQWGTFGSDPGEFNNPNAIAVGPDGRIYVLDSTNERVQVFTSVGVFSHQWGGWASTADPAWVHYPRWLTVSPDGHVLVLDEELVRRFTSDGDEVGSFRLDERAAALVAAADGRIFTTTGFDAETRIRQLDLSGTQVGDDVSVPMANNTGFAITDEGHFLLADGEAARILEVSGGDVVGAFGSPSPQPHRPDGVAVSPSGVVTTTDPQLDSVMQFAPDGSLLREWDGTLGDRDEGHGAAEVAMDSSNRSYVVDRDGNVVRIFDDSGTFVRSIGGPGTDPGRFDRPDGVAVDVDGSVYVADIGNKRIQVFDSAGAFVRSWADAAMDHRITDHLIAINTFDEVIVASGYSMRVFEKDGRLVRTMYLQHLYWSTGTIAGMATDSAGNIVIAAKGEPYFQRYSPIGELLEEWGASSDPMFNEAPLGIAIDASDHLFVADPGFRRVSRFRLPARERIEYPTVSMDRAPAAASRDDNPVFEFSSDIPDSTFECHFEEGPFEPCASPKTYGLPEGTYTFGVRAISPSGVTGDDVWHTFRIDRTAPSLSVIPRPFNRVDFSTAWWEPGLTFRCGVDGGADAPCSSPFDGRSLSDGQHALTVTVTDSASNATAVTKTFIVDMTAPVVTVPTGAYNSVPFSSDDSAATYRCRFDNGSAQTCTSPRASTGLSQGQHNLSVEATDKAGNVSGWVTASFIRDTVAPVITVASDAVNTVAFSSNETGTSFRCAVNGGSATGCSSPFDGRILADGQYTLTVTGTDAAGNASAPISRFFTVDTTAPVVTVEQGAVNTVTFSANESGTTFDCEVDGGEAASCTSPFDGTDLSDGTHTLAVTGTDRASNESSPVSETFTVDTTAPAVTVESGAYNEVDFSSDDDAATFGCRIDDGIAWGCSSPMDMTDLSEGTHTLSVSATDQAGNESSWVTESFVVDTVAPELSAPDEAFNTVTFASNDPEATVTCAIDGDIPEACDSPLDLTYLEDDEYTVTIIATDLAGNESEAATVALVVDTVAPVVTVESGAYNEVDFSSDEAATFRCKIDDGTARGCSSPFDGTDQSEGTHSLAVSATDEAGNESSWVTESFVVDTIAPQLSAPEDAVNDVSFSSNDPETTFTCAIDGDTAEACDSPLDLTDLADGEHTLTIVGMDLAGNESATAIVDVVVDTGAPVVTVEQDAINIVAFAANEADTTFECKINGDASGPCTSPFDGRSLADGAHTIAVRATDAASNESAWVTESFVVDTTAPVPTITRVVQSGRRARVSFTTEPSATTTCSIDGGAFVSCVSRWTTPRLRVGKHAVTVRATDAAGNTQNATKAFSIRRT